MKAKTRQQIVTHLSEVRLSPFLESSNGNYRQALTLYQWHTDLTSALSDVLGVTEIVLRNAIDKQLQNWNSRLKGDEKSSWLLEAPARPLDSLTRSKRKAALTRANAAMEARPKHHPRFGCPVTHDDVLAHTMFGLWRELLPNHLQNANPNSSANKGRIILWDNVIKNSFPYIEDPQGNITFWNVKHCCDLRNKVAHMDSLLNIDVLKQSKRAFAIVNSINPVVGTWLSSVSRVSEIYNQRP